ncbi:alpha/beta fold hydrolase [Stutzerimonas urumqiensis]|uniref:alpha/beta fold hydrolase n=1 Tax=Stutzerimonas urumqiensis TaxID=638269 RepID=UPI000EB385C3|nr:alpha/beta hydrolase [Stutzerimonas urumqiensis]
MPHSLFFAHANGFPSGTYTPLFEHLAPTFEVACLDRHAHDPRFPVEDNWQALVDELIHHLEAQSGPVLGVGHSLGGVLHYHAALRRPDLYKGLIMLDSPVATWLDQGVVWLAKRLGYFDQLTPAARTQGRRERFDDLAEARAYFEQKRLFRDFAPACLSAYLQHGLEPCEDGVRLRFDPETELRIYRSFPHRTPGWPLTMKVPLAMIRGRQSDVIKPHHTWLARLMPQGCALSLPGSHMFPLEHPGDTAEAIRTLALGWLGETRKQETFA